MDTLLAFALNQAAIRGGNTPKVFDWIKAAKLINQNKKGYIQAGLLEDLEWTMDTIWKSNTIIEDSYTYLASSWATPVIIIDDESYECWIYDTPKDNPHLFDAHTYWPLVARKIIKEKGVYDDI